MNTSNQVRLWAAQRLSAMVLAICVIVHLITIIYAVRSGLSADQILARTQGNVAWLAFYGIFVIAVSIHGPIGLRSVFSEWLGWRGRSADVFLLLLAVVLAWLGFGAVWGVYA